MMQNHTSTQVAQTPDLLIRFHVLIVPGMPTSPFNSLGQLELDYSLSNPLGQLHYSPWNSLVELRHPFELNWRGKLSRPEGLSNEVWNFMEPMEGVIRALVIERGSIDNIELTRELFKM